MAGAAGGFVTRAFESMLKECSGKKYPSLQKAIQSYLDIQKFGRSDNIDGVPHHTSSVAVEGSSSVEGDTEVMSSDINESEATSSPIRTVDDIPSSKLGALSNAGHTLDGAETELVLNPLQIAFATKNLKVLELALDCLHKLLAYDHLEGDLGVDGGQHAQLFTDILNMVCSFVEDSSSDSTTLLVLKVLLTAVASTKFRVHGEPLLAVVRVCYNIALNSKSPVNQATSKAMLIQIISIVFRRMETDPNTQSAEIEKMATLDEALQTSSPESFSITSVQELQNLVGEADIKGLEAVLDKAGAKITKGIDLENMVIAERDALLLFRTLCKMGMKEDSDEVTTRTRILSLELLQGLLEGVDHSFTRNFGYNDSVKACLTYVLLRASVSVSPVVFQYATGIFSVLLLRFRESLKAEVGVFFPLVVLRTLDRPESPLSHRMSVLRMVEKICKDPQLLVDVFVNYDCDIEAQNLFERTVTTLSKITQGTLISDSSAGGGGVPTVSVKGSSLQCLVNVLKSLVDWEISHTESGTSKRFTNGAASRFIRDSRDFHEKKAGEADNFEKAKAQKCSLEAAISEFNREPGKGVEYLISNGLVENSPASVAAFLRNSPLLNKVMIGNYLGQHDEFPLAVMNAYVDGMQFAGLKFSTAIRGFLQGFRLPGEAQKIDRIMEKFAERYCADNPGLFRSADTAYVLAYSVIMLNTDAHNPVVWPKMTKLDFVQMNSMNDAEESAPKELLEEVFDSIVKEEIKMKDDEADLMNSAKRTDVEERGYLINILKLTLPKRKSQTDTQSESEAIVKKTQAILRNRGAKRDFYCSHQVELVRPMMEAVGWPLLATFSVIMEEGEHKLRIGLCMEGFRAGIHITYVLGMDTMCYAFLTSLVRSTFLHAPKQMRSKNVEALRTLLGLCESDSECLQDTWNAVLECVSRLEFITTTPFVATSVMHTSNQLSRDAILQNLRELAEKPSEQVFLNSVRLPSDSVVEFFTSLCGVSLEELKQNPPRVFSLQKLVEISYYNMARIRMVWARIWSVLSGHFIVAGSHRDEKIAMYAIDSLRQLGMKYLERAELANFSFQNDILKPFVALIRNSRNESLRSLIVDSVVQMIKSKVGNIKSGWQSVFMIFTAAAADECESIVENAFENVEQVILEHFDQVAGDCFMDCVNCLIHFANNKKSHRISLKSVALLRICEDRLAEGFIPGGATKPIDASIDTALDVTEHYWFPMLAGLSDLTLDSRMEVRSCALEVLFDLLNERGARFSSSFWESIFHRVLFPIFDHVRNNERDSMADSDDNWHEETSVHSLQLLCNLFNTFYKEVSFLLPSLLGLLLDCAKKVDQSVVALSLGALVHLIEVGGHQFSIKDWETLLDGLRDALYMTQPLELLNALGFADYYKGHKMYEGHTEHDIARLSSTNSSRFGDRVARDDDPGFLALDSRRSGLISPSASAQKPTASDGGNQNNQTIGQRLMGNMMDNIFIRSLTSKSNAPASDISAPTSPVKPETPEPDSEEERDILLPATIRSKSITQLLLLGAVDCIQRKYWANLKARQKATVMDILLSTLEFAASYNSFTNLRMRMHQIPANRPPLSLLRQELAGTCIYLEVLQKATTELSVDGEQRCEDSVCKDSDDSLEKSSAVVDMCNGNLENLEHVAEEKLVSFCGQVLKEVSDIQSSACETNNLEIHQILELRSPIIVRVLKGMSSMNSLIFRKHLKEFYPCITKLVCCEQMDIRRALGDVFSMQLRTLLP